MHVGELPGNPPQWLATMRTKAICRYMYVPVYYTQVAYPYSLNLAHSQLTMHFSALAACNIDKLGES